MSDDASAVVTKLRAKGGDIVFDPDGVPYVAYLMSLEIHDDDLEQLRSIPSLLAVHLDHNTNITDSGVIHLDCLLALEELSLVGTSVSERGVQYLKKKLPECEVRWSRLT